MRYIITPSCFVIISVSVFAQSSTTPDSLRSYSASDSIYTNPEISAAYPGGSFAWNRFMERNLYPENEAGTGGIGLSNLLLKKTVP